MKAFSISHYNKNSELQLADMPEPIVREDEVLVEIYAASVNLLDLKIKSGEFKLILPYKMPLILGHDVAGVGTFAIQLAKHLGATVATTASEKSFDFLKDLGADVLIDYKTQNFEDVLIDYDVVLNSQDSKTLEKSFEVVKSQGKIISISGPPTPVFAEEFNLPWYVKFATKLLSSKVRKRAKKQNVNYSFLFMKADGKQLTEITKLIESGKIKPVIDKVFAFENTNDAVRYVESGRAKGKVVIKMK